MNINKWLLFFYTPCSENTLSVGFKMLKLHKLNIYKHKIFIVLHTISNIPIVKCSNVVDNKKPSWFQRSFPPYEVNTGF